MSVIFVNVSRRKSCYYVPQCAAHQRRAATKHPHASAVFLSLLPWPPPPHVHSAELGLPARRAGEQDRIDVTPICRRRLPRFPWQGRLGWDRSFWDFVSTVCFVASCMFLSFIKINDKNTDFWFRPSACLRWKEKNGKTHTGPRSLYCGTDSFTCSFFHCCETNCVRKMAWKCVGTLIVFRVPCLTIHILLGNSITEAVGLLGSVLRSLCFNLFFCGTTNRRWRATPCQQSTGILWCSKGLVFAFHRLQSHPPTPRS